jgi:hypothetical protein
VQKLSERDLARTWSLYAKELAVLLWAVQGRDATPEVLLRMQALGQHELLFMYFQCARRPRACSVRLLTNKLQACQC